MNRDNVSDLVVGHPYSGAEELKYHGGVSVFLGDITAGQFSLSSSPSFSVRCSEHPCSLGGGSNDSNIVLLDCYHNYNYIDHVGVGRCDD